MFSTFDSPTLMFLVYLSGSLGQSKFIHVEPKDQSSGVVCLKEVGSVFFFSNEKFTRTPNLLLTHISNMTSPAANIQLQYIKMMNAIKFNKAETTYLIRVISDSARLKAVYAERNRIVSHDYYVIIVDSLRNFKDILRDSLSKSPAWNPGGRFLILYNNVANRNTSEKTAEDIFGYMLNKLYVSRVVLLYATNSTAYDVLLMGYFNTKHCRQAVPIKVTSCNGGKLANVVALKYNLVVKPTLKNCSFTLCAKVSAPFVEEDCIQGIELTMMGMIRERMKFTLLRFCGALKRGVLLDNGTWTDLLGMLNKRSCDFILGGFYPDNEIHQYFWVTDSYLRDSHTWFVSRAPKRPPWQGLISVLHYNTWECFVGVLILTWTVWYILGCLQAEDKAHHSVSMTGANSLAVTLGVSIFNRPVLPPLRIFFVVLAIYGLNITTIYTSRLIAVFSNPGYSHQISTIEEVIERKIPFGGPKESQDWFEDDKDELDRLIFKLYKNTSQFETKRENLQRVVNGSQVMLSNRMHVLQSPMHDKVYGFPKDIFDSPLEMIAKKGFPFLYDFNIIIRRMRDAGLFDKIYKDFIYNNTILRRIKRDRLEVIKPMIVLTIEHLDGAFIALTLGLTISAIIFIGELLLHRYIQRSFKNHRNYKENSNKLISRMAQKHCEIKFSPLKRRYKKSLELNN